MDLLGFLWGLIALVGESTSDNQLKTFLCKTERRGHVCKIGLWRYSRHPNYFFEWLFWWAFVLFSIGSDVFCGVDAGSACHVFVSKVSIWSPFAELSSIERRGSEYLKYQKETSVFFPFKPKL